MNILLQYTSSNNDALAKKHAHLLAYSFFVLDDKPDSLNNVPRHSGYASDVTGSEAFVENYQRVRRVNSKVDPGNVFNKWRVSRARYSEFSC